MADQHDLKSLYKGIDVSEEEMLAYRVKLAQSLPISRSYFSMVRPIFVLCALALAVYLFYPRTALNQRNLDELNQWVSQNPKEAVRAAKVHLNEAGLAGDNAAMVLALTSPEEDAMSVVSKALRNEPRPEFRLYYLEYLLDRTDSYFFNPEILDALMEKETDPYCLRLYRQLLWLS